MAEDFNISPEMIDNLMNILKNSSNNSSDNTEYKEKQENVNSDNIANILSKFTSNSNSENNSNSNIDIQTIMKMKSIMEAMNNSNDPRSNLLYSLKPYLRKSRQSKLDQYANLLKMTQVTGLFKNEKGEEK